MSSEALVDGITSFTNILDATDSTCNEINQVIAVTCNVSHSGVRSFGYITGDFT